MAHFDNSHSVWNEIKMPFFEVWVSLVLMQNPGILNFHGFLTLNNGKFYILKASGMIFTNMDVLAFFWFGFLHSLSHHMLKEAEK